MHARHPVDALRLADDRRRELGERWPRDLEVRRAIAYWLLRLAIRLDPPRRRPGRTLGTAVRR
jgi:hypothetical protein